ncbi:DUF4082 domain-containing protein [Tersicoccus phoenicis]|uniref:DUF4082 domain-containing protein n=1 Tax=Tersicoccus phoenicis TaxID=554083 RepID=UPI0013564A51|nr:DUF4082 domain-containing protein [Tersicoccus phoenicis]
MAIMTALSLTTSLTPMMSATADTLVPTPGASTGPAPTTPSTVTVDDDRSVELGSLFSPTDDGVVSAIRFYKGAANVGPHTVTLWSADGRELASGAANPTDESNSGWQTITLPTPVKIAKGSTYIASYLAPRGRYSADLNGRDDAVTVGALTYPVGSGVYAYGNGGNAPSQRYQNANYFVEPVFTPGNPSPATPAPTTTVTPTPSTPAPSALNLPRIPWEGGSAYWKQFSKANAAGWSDPSFFPIVAWYNGISSNREAAYDKSVGINTYIGMDPSTPYSLFRDNGVYWIGGKLNSSFTDASTNWVGNFLDDEVDGRFTPAEGRQYLQNLSDQAVGTGRFRYANFTQMVMSADMNQQDARAYVNNYTDAVSLDMYWYTIPFCSNVPFRQNYILPITQENCRTASSYGTTMKALRQQDATDGKLQAPWQFVELLNGGPGEGPFTANVSADQLKGAVMASVINEARGIVYFNQSLSGPCQGGSLIRQAQTTSGFCGADQVRAASEVNNQIKSLAPVLNTQSYQYSFGSGLDTMLKSYNGDAYVFAMIDGKSSPGSRTFRLPSEFSASSVEVVGENRSIPVSGGVFTDGFANESSYHIYRVKL